MVKHQGHGKSNAEHLLKALAQLHRSEGIKTELAEGPLRIEFGGGEFQDGSHLFTQDAPQTG